MPKNWQEPPTMHLDMDATYQATLVTSEGDVVADLFAADAPVTVNNFVFLARQGYYDGVPFTGSSRISWCRRAILPAMAREDQATASTMR